MNSPSLGCDQLAPIFREFIFPAAFAISLTESNERLHLFRNSIAFFIAYRRSVPLSGSWLANTFTPLDTEMSIWSGSACAIANIRADSFS